MVSFAIWRDAPSTTPPRRVAPRLHYYTRTSLPRRALINTNQTCSASASDVLRLNMFCSVRYSYDGTPKDHYFGINCTVSSFKDFVQKSSLQYLKEGLVRSKDVQKKQIAAMTRQIAAHTRHVTNLQKRRDRKKDGGGGGEGDDGGEAGAPGGGEGEGGGDGGEGGGEAEGEGGAVGARR